MMGILLCAALVILIHSDAVFANKPHNGACRDKRDEFGFALVGHDYKSAHAENFGRCFFKCSLEERCQSVTYLWNNKECKINNETKNSRPEAFEEHPAATYMENSFRGMTIDCIVVVVAFFFFVVVVVVAVVVGRHSQAFRQKRVRISHVLHLLFFL